MWAESTCMETQSGEAYLDTHTGHSFEHTFDKKNCKCNEKEVYYQHIGDSMIIITKEKFIELNSKKHSTTFDSGMLHFINGKWINQEALNR